ncbi:hypothetical protein ACH4TV_35255 [Streptomyces sp. NPDC020898]|uniref:hypothetical protein n=1 Tax=Streptomyces sp. NPDC020898 TaxID=3365101 RepID=UPI0037962130
MVIAETGGLVGCASGFPVRGDGFWWLGFDGALPRAVEQLTASGGDFAITDIPVRPHPQDAQVARRSQERLPADQQASVAVIGFRISPAAGQLLRVSALPLCVRTATRPAGPAHDAWTRWPA